MRPLAVNGAPPVRNQNLWFDVDVAWLWDFLPCAPHYLSGTVPLICFSAPRELWRTLLWA